MPIMKDKYHLFIYGFNVQFPKTMVKNIHKGRYMVR